MEARTLTYAQAIQEALAEEMERDERVFVMGEDVGVWGNLYGCTKDLLARFGGDRVVDTPIAEAGFTGCAVGSAAAGLRPVVEIMFIDFVSRAMDQLVNHAARWHQLSNGKVTVPLVVRTQGGVGTRNSSQHSQSLENWFVNVPGLLVVMPATPYDAKGLLKSSIRDDNPVVFIEHKGLYRTKGAVPREEYLVPLGAAEVKREGTDVTIVANSLMVLHALAAAGELAAAGVSAEVIDPRTLYPLDEDTIYRSVRKTGRCIVVNEAPSAGGWAGEVSALVAENCFAALRGPVRRVTGKRTGIPYGKDLEPLAVPSVRDIVGEAISIVKA